MSHVDAWRLPARTESGAFCLRPYRRVARPSRSAQEHWRENLAGRGRVACAPVGRPGTRSGRLSQLDPVGAHPRGAEQLLTRRPAHRTSGTRSASPGDDVPRLRVDGFAVNKPCLWVCAAGPAEEKDMRLRPARRLSGSCEREGRAQSHGAGDARTCGCNSAPTPGFAALRGHATRPPRGACPSAPAWQCAWAG